MGQSRKRVGRNGDVRYTAYYEDARGSAGTFTSLKAANKAWQQAETKVAEGRGGQSHRGRQLFERYVEDVWFPNHVMELTTRQNYTYSLNRHIMPTFAEFRMVDILPADVREWVAKLQIDGVNPPTIRYAMTVLSAIFATALNDQITFLQPCMGVKTPTVATKRRRIITPDQFGALYDAIPTRELQLLVETDVETGLRWGELIELRKKDIDLDTGVITVSRVAGELAAKFNPDGQRFFVKQYPKDTEWRAVTLSEHMFDELDGHARGLKPDDLLFKAGSVRASPHPPTGITARPRHPRTHRTQRQRSPIPPRHHQRLRRRRLPLPTLQRRLRRLPSRPPRRRQRQPPPTPTPRHRRPHPPRLVPPHDLEPRPRSRRAICDLNPAFDLSQPTISHHLKVLHEAGLLDRDKRGVWVYYRAHTEALASLGALIGDPSE